MSSKYFSIEEQSRLRSNAAAKVAASWLLGFLALWLYANQPQFVSRFWFVWAAVLILSESLFYSGIANLVRSKGYSKWLYWLAVLQAVGLVAALFLPDKWQEQEIPKLNLKNLNW